MTLPNAGNESIKDHLYKAVFPHHWQKCCLYDLAKWTNGLAFRSIDFTLTGRPVIKIAEIKNGISGQTKFTEKEFDPSVFVTNGDMLFSWSGQPQTSIDVFIWRGSDGWLNQHVFKVEPKGKYDRQFFFYLLKYLKPNFVGIARNKQTTGLGHVTKSDLRRIEVRIPRPAEQGAIASILGALDDKIELNRKMNRTLEEMAKALFKSWFVDFDPLHAKVEGRKPFGVDDATAALFPDEFEDSKLGPIPKGWRVSTIGSEFNLTMGQSPPGSTYNERQKGVVFYQGRTDFGFRFPTPRMYCTKPTRFADTRGHLD